MRDYPAHEDLGLDPDADKTPDLRPGNEDVPGAGTPGTSETTTQQSQKGLNTMVIQAPDRAIEHLKEARMYVKRMILPASGERRLRATRVAETITALIAEIENLERGRK